MGEEKGARSLAEAQLDLLRLTVRLSCHAQNNHLTSASIHLYGKSVDPAEWNVSRDALKSAVQSMTREVESLHLLAVGGEGKPRPAALYELRDPIVKLVRVAKKNMPVIDADPSGPWAEIVSVRAAIVRLVVIERALAALEIDPKAVVRLQSVAAGGGLSSLVLTAPIDASAWNASPGAVLADRVAADEGWTVRAATGVPATYGLVFPAFSG